MKIKDSLGLGLTTILGLTLITSCAQEPTQNAPDAPAIDASPMPQTAQQTAGSEDTIARLQITERGLYVVTGFDLQNAGIDVGSLSPDDLSVTHLGQPQAVTVQDLDGNGQFNSTDQLVFFGQTLRGETTHRYKHAEQNTYLLHVDSSKRPSAEGVMRNRELGPTPSDLVNAIASPELTQVSLQRMVHLEEDNYWSDRFRQAPNAASDFSFYVQLDFLRRDSASIPFDLAGLDPDSDAPVTLALEFYGRSNASPRLEFPDHSLEVKINDHVIGLAEWQNDRPHRAIFEGVDPSLLHPADNRLTLTLNKRPEVMIDVILFDWAEILYPVHPVVEANSGEFALVGASTGTQVQLTGLTSPNAHLFSLTDQRVIEPDIIEDYLGGTTLSFTATVDNGLYAVATDDELLRPAAIERFEPRLSASPEDETYEFLIITHSLFLDAAERLAAHRRSNDGLTVKVVTAQDVYDRHNHGIPHPDAISRALRDIHENAPRPGLRYVLLMGDTTWDWHGLSQPTVTYIPTQYEFGPDVEFAADNLFVMFGQSGRPQIALGRLPVGSVEEAEGVVNKLIAYDEGLEEAESQWRNGIVFAASDKPKYRNFLDTAVDTHVEGNFDLTRLYASNDSPLDCTQRLIDGFNEGAAFVSYVGHGARYVWQTGTTLVQRAADYETNFNPDRIDELFNTPRLPIVFGITCFTNNFDNPNPRDCIGEKLVLREEGGALASIATSSYSYVHSDMIFCDQMFEALFEQENIERVGDLFLAALQSETTPLGVCKLFMLLGDPTARIPLLPIETEEVADTAE